MHSCSVMFDSLQSHVPRKGEMMDASPRLIVLTLAPGVGKMHVTVSRNLLKEEPRDWIVSFSSNVLYGCIIMSIR